MKVPSMKAALFDRPGRIAFTMSRWNMLRLAKNAFLAAVRGEIGICITTGDLEVLTNPDDPCSTRAEGKP